MMNTYCGSTKWVCPRRFLGNRDQRKRCRDDEITKGKRRRGRSDLKHTKEKKTVNIKCEKGSFDS